MPTVDQLSKVMSIRQSSATMEELLKRKTEEPQGGSKRFQSTIFEDGFSLHKIRYEKFISVRAKPSEGWLSVVIGEWEEFSSDKWEKTNKSIILNQRQFQKLAAIIISRKGLAKTPMSDESQLICPSSHLGSGINLTWSPFNRSNLARIRSFYRSESGDRILTKRGISFAVCTRSL